MLAGSPWILVGEPLLSRRAAGRGYGGVIAVMCSDLGSEICGGISGSEQPQAEAAAARAAPNEALQALGTDQPMDISIAYELPTQQQLPG